MFDGLNWANTPNDRIFYYATFKKFDLSTKGQGAETIFSETTTTCRHLVTLFRNEVVKEEQFECVEKVRNFKIVNGTPQIVD